MTTQLIQRAYKFVLRPTRRQIREFDSHAGAARFVYNWGLARVGEALDAYSAQKKAGIEKPDVKIPDHFTLCKMWTAYKDQYREEPDPVTGRPLAWVSKNFVGTYQAGLRDAATAWKNFFASRSGARVGRRMGRPKFKSKKRSRPSFQVHGATLRMADKSHIVFPKIGMIKIPGMIRIGAWKDRNGRIALALARALRKGDCECPPCRGSGQVVKVDKNKVETMVVCKACKSTGRVPSARIVRATISRGASGIWWCSVTAEVVRDIPDYPSRRQRDNGVVGLDLGTMYLAVDSDGTIYENPQHLEQAQMDLRTAQRAFARTQVESNRHRKAKQRVGQIHERVALMRRDHTNKLTTEIARKFAAVAVEGFDLQQMASRDDKKIPKKIREGQNRRLADAAPGLVRWQLGYKFPWRGGVYLQGGKTLETGRTCSVCGGVNDKAVPLSNPLFSCQRCATKMDRRVNSARVIRKELTGGQYRTPETVSV